MVSFVNSIIDYISPFAMLNQEKNSESSYNAWKKPPETEVQFFPCFSEEPSVERGAPNIIFDTFAKVISSPFAIFSFTGQDTSDEVSERTLNIVKDYLLRNQLGHVKVVSKLYDPSMIWKRTWTNPRTMFITKLFSGSLNALAQTIFPMRLLGGRVNVYDQYTDVVTLNNNDVAMGLFAAAQAKGTAMHRNPTMYNSAKDFLPLMTPIQNLACSQDVISYLKSYGSGEDLKAAYKSLGTSSGVDFAVDVMSNPVFSVITTAATSYALKGTFFSKVDQAIGETQEQFMKRIQEQALKDQLTGYFYALPFIATCAFIGYCYGRALQRQSESDTSR